MVFTNCKTGTVVVVLGKDEENCQVEALEYVARKVAKSLRTVRSMDKMASFRIALNLLHAIPVEKYVRTTYTGKAQVHWGTDSYDVFDEDFGKRLAMARARRAYWHDVAAYMLEVEELLDSLSTSFSYKADAAIDTLAHFEMTVADLHLESEKNDDAQ